jgi:hypothetical protein
VIHAAKPEDIPRIVEMARDFHEKYGEAHDFIEEDAAAFIAASMERGCVLASEASFLIGIVAPDPANFGVLIGHEVFWWSSEGKGTELREAFEEWTKAMGANEVQFSHPWTARRVGAMLKKAGYEPATKVWRKVI